MIVPLPQALLRTRRGKNRRCCTAPKNATASELSRGNTQGTKGQEEEETQKEAAHQKRVSTRMKSLRVLSTASMEKRWLIVTSSQTIRSAARSSAARCVSAAISQKHHSKLRSLRGSLNMECEVQPPFICRAAMPVAATSITSFPWPRSLAATKFKV